MMYCDKEEGDEELEDEVTLGGERGDAIALG